MRWIQKFFFFFLFIFLYVIQVLAAAKQSIEKQKYIEKFLLVLRDLAHVSMPLMMIRWDTGREKETERVRERDIVMDRKSVAM